MPHVKFRLQFWRCFFISCLCRTRHTSVRHWYMFYVMLYNVKHLWLITGFVTRVTRRVPLAEQELIILLKHLSSPPVLVEFVFGLFSFLCSCFLFVFFFLSDLSKKVSFLITHFISSNSSKTNMLLDLKIENI